MATEPPPTIGEAMVASRRVVDRMWDAVAGEPVGIVMVAAASLLVTAARLSGVDDAELLSLVQALLVRRKGGGDAD